MSKMFGNMTTDGLETSSDRLGAGGVLDTDLYSGTVKLAYAGKSSGGAQSVTVVLELSGREYREIFYVTNKQGENFYVDKNDNTKKQPMMGFASVDDLCLLTTGFPLSEQSVEDKVVKIYDFEQKKDIPTNVPVLVDLLGKPVSAGILKQIVDKQKKDSTGVYRNTGETREENVVDKFFHAETARTVNEIKDGIQTGVFAGKWVDKNKGETRNKAKGSVGTAGMPGGASGGSKGFNPGGNSGNGGAAGAGGTQKKSLFGN